MMSEATDDSTAQIPGTEISDLMYTLGEIARVVFPNGDIPTALQVQLLGRPAVGLGMLTRCDSYQKADRRVLGPLFCKLPPNFQTPHGVSEEAKDRFWEAYLGD